MYALDPSLMGLPQTEHVLGSAIYCNSGSTFKTFGTIADCCTTAGNCNPATECFAGELLYFDDGSASTCEGGCDTGYIYKTMNDPAPRSMYGCFDQFDLYRTINAAAMSSTDGTSTDGSSPSSTLSSASSNTSTSTPLQGSKHTAIIAAAVVVVVVLLAAIAGLVTWILLLKRKQRKQTVPTELRPMPSDSNTAFETKAELASKEISTAELPSPLTNPNVPYSSTTSPVSSIQKQPDWQKYTPQPDTMELPAYSVRGNYQELPG